MQTEQIAYCCCKEPFFSENLFALARFEPCLLFHGHCAAARGKLIFLSIRFLEEAKAFVIQFACSYVKNPFEMKWSLCNNIHDVSIMFGFIVCCLWFCFRYVHTFYITPWQDSNMDFLGLRVDALKPCATTVRHVTLF
jgi:hypothetical protein